MSNIKEVLAALNALSEKNSFEVFLPSLKREVKFKSLTAKQQKYFYECVKDNVVFNTKFVIATYNIIKENCFELDIVDRLTVVDRAFILLAYRKYTLGNELQIEKDGTIFNTTIDNCLEQAKTIQLPQNKLVSIKNVQVELHVPTVLDQYGLEKELRESLADEAPEIDQLISSVILNEISKTVKEVWLIGGENALPVGFNLLKHSERLEVVENLPAEIMFEMQSFVGEVNAIMNKALTITTDSDSVGFDITVDFFLDA